MQVNSGDISKNDRVHYRFWFSFDSATSLIRLGGLRCIFLSSEYEQVPRFEAYVFVITKLVDLQRNETYCGQLWYVV